MSARWIARWSRVALLSFLLSLAAPPLSARAAEDWESIPPNRDLDILYAPADQKLVGVRSKLMEYKFLERLQRFFSPLRLPYRLQLRADQCNQVNAYYSPSERAIRICYELIQYLVANAPKNDRPNQAVSREAAIYGGLAGAVLHESGHMMFDLFDVPRFGREEDAADELSTFLALQVSKNVAKSVVIGFEYFFYLSVARGAESPGAPLRAWADEHGSSSQRVYNILCLAYGADPDQFKQFVDRGWLPKARAVGCADEYNTVKHAFEQTISPYLDPALMARVRAVEWLPPAQAQVDFPSHAAGTNWFPHPGAGVP